MFRITLWRQELFYFYVNYRIVSFEYKMLKHLSFIIPFFYIHFAISFSCRLQNESNMKLEGAI